MEDLLQSVWLDNTVGSYLISLGLILFFWLFRHLASRLTALLVARFFTHKNDKERKHLFRSLVAEPIERFLTILVIILALDRLHYPEAFEVSFFHISLRRSIESIAAIALIISFIWLCNRIIRYAAELLKEKAGETPDRSDDQLVVFFRDFLKVISWITGLLLILKFAFGYNVSNLLTSLSIVGAALALAFRESLENLIASFIIFFDKPFTTGDVVKVESVTGTVDKIGLRSTRIRTTDKTYTTVPNKKMVDNIVDNQSLRSERNVLNKVEFDTSADIVALEAFISDIDNMLTQLEHVNDWHVFLADAGGQASVVQVEYFVSMQLNAKQFFKLRQQVNIDILRLGQQHGLKFASGQEIRILNESAPETKPTRDIV